MECQQPVWIPDNRVAQCGVCRRDFGIVLNRHHCRACGYIFCDPCSQNQIALPQFGFVGPQRVCNPCHKFQEKRLQYHYTYIEAVTRGCVVWSYVNGDRFESHLSLTRNGQAFVCRQPSSQIPVESILSARKGLHPSSKPSSFCCFGEQVDDNLCFHVLYGKNQSLSFELTSPELANFWCAAVSGAPEVLTQTTAPATSRLTSPPTSPPMSPPISPPSSPRGVDSHRSTYSTYQSDVPYTRQPTKEETDRAERAKANKARRDEIKAKYSSN